jgi:hypothetical protein
MNGFIEPPPQQRGGMGCFGKGCLILSVFILFLMVACAIGLYFGLKKNSALLYGIYWAEKTHMLATEPSPVPLFETTEENIEASERKWRDFERASHEGQPERVELTGDDLNNLIARNDHLRGKAFASIEGNRLHVQASLPVGEYLGRNGYYVNGDIVIQTNGPSSIDHPPLTSITVNGEAMPSDLPEWKFRSHPLRNYAAKYKGNANTFEVRDGRIILSRVTP